MQQFSPPLHRHPSLPSDTHITPHRHPRLPFVTYAFHRHHPRLPPVTPAKAGAQGWVRRQGLSPNRVPSYSTRSPRPSPSLPSDTHLTPHRHPRLLPSPPPPPRHPRESGAQGWVKGQGLSAPNRVPSYSTQSPRPSPSLPSDTHLTPHRHPRLPTVTPASPPRKRGSRDGTGGRAFPPKSRASKRDAIPVVSPASPASPSAGSSGHRTTGDCSRSACSRWPLHPVPRRNGHAPAPFRC